MWVHRDIGRSNFAWQEGYAAFTVSATTRTSVQGYIARQEHHHCETSFREELIELLGGPDQARPRAYPIAFDIDGNTIGGPPPRIDFDSTLEHGTGPWDQILIDFPPRPPEVIPF